MCAAKKKWMRGESETITNAWLLAQLKFVLLVLALQKLVTQSLRKDLPEHERMFEKLYDIETNLPACMACL